MGPGHCMECLCSCQSRMDLWPWEHHKEQALPWWMLGEERDGEEWYREGRYGDGFQCTNLVSFAILEVPKKSLSCSIIAMSSHLQTTFCNPSEVKTLSMQTLHEATLQELIQACNEAVFQLLHERNKLMHEWWVSFTVYYTIWLSVWRNTLHGDDTKFPAFNFFSPPGAMNILYTVKSIDGECYVLHFCASRPLGARYPANVSVSLLITGCLSYPYTERAIQCQHADRKRRP